MARAKVKRVKQVSDTSSAEFRAKFKDPLLRLRQLADQYVSTQKLLFAAESRIRSVEQGVDDSPGVPEMVQKKRDAKSLVIVDPYCDTLRLGLDKILLEMESYVSYHPAYSWLMGVPGVNRTIACKLGGLITMFSEDSFNTFSKLRKFAGYAPGFDRPVKGERLCFNRSLKTAVFVAGDCLVKAYYGAMSRDPFPRDYHPERFYPEVYEKWRGEYARRHGVGAAGEKYLRKHELWSDDIGGYRVMVERADKSGKVKKYPEWPDLRQHRAALRKMYDVFLCNLWEVWRAAKGWNVRPLWSHVKPGDLKQGHQFMYKPEWFSSPLLAERKSSQHAAPADLEEMLSDEEFGVLAGTDE